ncbi:uncharacterized protein LOC121807992 [Salvia splendens]|uniref:uncharacterized protein LOC121807992 n=1 Tax=Salvia splendens TaxID=180675 RepID=UPI001C252F3D|nr:uncharacterized protein LOC121807992 [Salvia splendens]
MRRLFPKSNSSSSAAPGPANELIDPPKSADFSTKVGFLQAVKGESTVKNSFLQRCFVDLVTGDSRAKQNAAARFDDMVGQTDSCRGDSGSSGRGWSCRMSGSLIGR